MLGVSCFFIVMSPERRVGGKSGDAGVGFRGLVDAAHPIGREGASQSWRRNHVEAARGQLLIFTPKLLDESFAKP